MIALGIQIGTYLLDIPDIHLDEFIINTHILDLIILDKKVAEEAQPDSYYC